ncbi:MAG TPA: tRNA epoxyqueuosine(34) reductase QueG [Pyrinomonadaceae bacterium]|nr:tRNA epoxyqueuosine(34) reductase QueG [Pyrinomonadaceae bacterium]
MPTFADRIKQKAAEIGFQKTGIVSAEPLKAEGKNLLRWLDSGFQGEMAWLAREPEKRSDPRLIFAEARSVVVVAHNYHTPHKHLDDPKKGKLSRYAWGDDYHDIVREKLGLLLQWIKSENPQAEGKICVDTAPMMDKAWAVRAGVGWLGKHSNVITTDLGSWVFIGEIILNLELDYEAETIDDHCGTCTACLDACPTDAIVEPYVVDSRKCISYATIELRDEKLPADIAEKLNGWIYGCDICQDVCPWNRFEKPADEPRFEPRSGETSLDLDEVSDMEHENYVTRFRRSAIKRAKLTGLKRNAAALSDVS